MSKKEIRLPEGLDADSAFDVLREYANTEDAEIINKSRLDSLESEITSAKEAFAAVLAEDSPQSADTLSRQDMDALTEPFRNEEGEIDVDTLRQEPETGSNGGENGSNGAGNGGDGFDPDTLGFGAKQELDTLKRKRSTFKNRGMDARASEIEDEMIELSGAEDYDTLETEVF